MEAELYSHNFLSAISFLMYPLNSCSQRLCFTKKVSFNFQPDGSNYHKNFEAHLLDYKQLR